MYEGINYHKICRAGEFKDFQYSKKLGGTIESEKTNEEMSNTDLSHETVSPSLDDLIIHIEEVFRFSIENNFKFLTYLTEMVYIEALDIKLNSKNKFPSKY